jgi:subtilisin family serine protease
MKKALAFAAALACCFAHQAQAGRLAPALEDQMRGMEGTDEVKVLVVLREQADIPSLNTTLSVTRAPMSRRHREVVDTLRDVAARTQTSVIQALSSSPGVRGYTSYWIMNALTVVGTVDAIRALSEREDIELIEPDLRVELIEPLPVDNRKEGALPRGSITPGVLAIQADRVWSELGIDGTGALVGNMDTGVDGAHPALSARWRGNFAPASECWRDALGLGHSTPQDNHGHGTHTMGTIAGTAPGNEIGVAPGALWIADNTINQGVGSEFDNDVLAGLQWFTDPDGNSNTTDDVPDVVQHSWGVFEGLGYGDCFSLWWTALDNCEAAGVVNTWSAGNEGPGASSLRSPADRASTPYNAFSVGATQATVPYTIASFSSRGPSTCPGTLFPIKPEVSAPGVNTWSAAPGGGYQFLSGTSMAGPHVAGVVALMRAANPDVDVDTVKQILMDTATDLGSAGEDNTYGHGIVNAYDAVLAVLSGYGQAAGTVTESGSGTPIAAAFVDVLGDSRSAVADANGDFDLFLPAGNWMLEYSAFGYVTTTQNIEVLENDSVDASQALVLASQATVSGIVRDFEGALVEGATVSVVDTPLSPVLSLADGSYSIAVPDLATYEIRARKDGFGADQLSVAVNGNTTQDFVLPELLYEDFESGDFLNWPWSHAGNAPWTIDSGNAYEGTYSARSGLISDNQSSSMVMTLYLVAGGDISFWYNVSSEANFDFLRFYIDGAQQSSWSGSVPWTQATYPVGAGLHTFEWRYDKDGSVSTGSDAAWVDLVNFPTAAFPEVAVAPTSLSEVLGYDQQVDRNLAVQNLGDGPLQYTVEIAGVNAPVAGMGGPDNFGYRWVDSDAGGGPTYDWFDISGVGTAIPLGDEQMGPVQLLGFNFNYYGNVYASIRACSNGYLALTSNAVEANNAPIPSAAAPNNFIAPFWDDLDPSAGGTVYSYQDAGNGRFIVQWNNVRRKSTGTAHTFQAIIQDDSRLIFQYASVSEVDECTVGIENNVGNDGLEVAFNEAYLHDGLAILFTDEPLPEWLDVSPTGGTVDPQSSSNLLVTFDSTDLLDGTYMKTIRIHTNDTDEPTVDVLATLTVTADATDVSLEVSPLAFQLAVPRPNPFGSVTAIDFAVPTGGAAVRIVVFDVTGRLVRTLVNETRPAGRHSVSWDGRDSGGQRAASGIYFYRMDAGGFSQVQKVTLLK